MIVDTHCHLSSKGLANAISRYTHYKLLIDKEKGVLSTALSEKMPIVNEKDRIVEMDELGINVSL